MTEAETKAISPKHWYSVDELTKRMQEFFGIRDSLVDTARQTGIRFRGELRDYLKGKTGVTYLIQDLLRTKGLTLSIGDSHVGKSPFWCQACVAVAAGLDTMLGRTVNSVPGTCVVYFDCENNSGNFEDRLVRMSRYLGLEDRPESIGLWNLNDLSPDDNFFTLGWFEWLRQRCAAVRPKLLIIDPMSGICPEFGDNRRDTAKIIKSLRRLVAEFSLSIVIVHHLRKESPKPDDQSEPLRDAQSFDEIKAWFNKAVGSGAVVNMTDIRVGMDYYGAKDKKGSEVVIKGFEREGHEQITPLLMYRVISEEDGDPLAYELIPADLGRLNPVDRELWKKLPVGQEFPRSLITELHPGKSSARTVDLTIKTLREENLLRLVKRGVYVVNVSDVRVVG